jgi:adenylate kinase
MKQIVLKCETNLFMLGAPGSGKGTYSKMLSKDLNLNVLSSGDELRNYVENEKNKISQEIKKIIEDGQLVEDNFMFDFIKNKLNNQIYRNGLILDGYPRRLSQARQFENYKHINMVIKIDLDEEILIKKMLGRRVCKNCGKNYNLCSIDEKGYLMKPLLPNKSFYNCDNCGGDLIKRTDDVESIIRERLNIYNELTSPLEEYFEDKNLVVKFVPKKGIDDYQKLYELVTNKLKSMNYI